MERLAALVSTLASECRSLYRTKLQKAAFFCDFLACERLGRSISGVRYAHATYGPKMDDGDSLLEGGDPREWAAPPQNVDYLLEYLDYSSGVQRAVALQAACGLRLSESVSIEWPDLTDVAFVRKSKTDAGKNRIVPMPERVLARLEPHRRTTGAVSGGVRADSVRRWVTRHAVEMFVPGATPHGLRHSFCTRLAKAKVHPRVMMELMGHASMDVCMRIYTHVNNDDKIAAIRDAFG